MADKFTVVGQRQTVDLGADGRFVDVIEVTYRTAEGVSGSVRVPLERFNADYVRGRIEERVEHHDAVGGL